MHCILIFLLISTACALLSPVSGPWPVSYSVDVRVSYANATAGLVQVDVGASPHMLVTQEGAVAVVLATSIGTSTYSLGTAWQEGGFLYCPGATFIPSMVDGAIIWSPPAPPGTYAYITGYINATTLRVTPAQTIPTGPYVIHYGGALPVVYLPLVTWEGIMVETSLGWANVMLSQGGELVLWLCNDTMTNIAMVPGQVLEWPAFSFRYYRALHSTNAPATTWGPEALVLLPIEPTPQPLALPQYNGQSLGMVFGRGDDGQVTATLLSNMWQWNSSDYSTHVITFGTMLPRKGRPMERLDVVVPLGVHTFTLGDLTIYPNGRVVLRSATAIGSPASLARDVTITYKARPRHYTCVLEDGDDTMTIEIV